jgi:uncharacterized membrane protein YeaQ/YmgE (transglycosylase-associated protein family)
LDHRRPHRRIPGRQGADRPGHGPNLWDIVVGIVGAFVGGWLAGLVGIAVTNILVQTVVAFVGAVILLAIFRAIAGSRGRSHA